jgi:hypothetical protein
MILEEVEKRIKDISNDNFFPTRKEIIELAGWGLYGRVEKLGGIYKLAPKFNMKIRNRYISTDDHVLRSSYEYVVDEYLFSRNIEHEIDGIIDSSSGKNFRYDFKLSDHYIEVWGYIGVDYNKTRILKEKFYQSLNFNLISIEGDIFNLEIKELENYLDNLFFKHNYNTVPSKDNFVNLNENIRLQECWTDDIIISHVQEIIDKMGYFPTIEQLLAIDKETRTLVWHINHNGGINKFREILGAPILKRQNGYWNDEIIIGELKKVITSNNGKFPSLKELNKLGETALTGAILSSGRINKFRKIMGYTVNKRERWTDENIIKELREIIYLNNNQFPNEPDFKRLNKKFLWRAMIRHGGLNRFRKAMGYPINRRENGHWTQERIISESKRIIEQLGHFPTKDEFKQINETGLFGAITQRVGISKLKTLIGYK